MFLSAHSFIHSIDHSSIHHQERKGNFKTKDAKMNATLQLFALALLGALLLLVDESAARLFLLRGPIVIIESVENAAAAPSKAAVHARQLVHDNEWTTMSTLSVQFKGVPWGNIVSYSGKRFVMSCVFDWLSCMKS